MGTKYYIAFTLSYSLTFVSSKLLYDRNPDLTPDMLLLLRSVWATLLVFSIINVNAKKILYDDVDRVNVAPLTFRSIQGSIGSMINFASAKQIPLATIGVVNNLSPICCSLLAVCILGERLTQNQTIFLLLTTLGVIIVILGKPSESSSVQ